MEFEEIVSSGYYVKIACLFWLSMVLCLGLFYLHSSEKRYLGLFRLPCINHFIAPCALVFIGSFYAAMFYSTSAYKNGLSVSGNRYIELEREYGSLPVEYRERVSVRFNEYMDDGVLTVAEHRVLINFIESFEGYVEGVKKKSETLKAIESLKGDL